MTDKELLKEAIKKSGYKIYYIAEKIGLSYQGLQNKINGINDFRQSEIIDLCDLLNITNEDRDKIFFANNVDIMPTNE